MKRGISKGIVAPYDQTTLGVDNDYRERKLTEKLN